jgi:hypothetical protein
MEKKIVILARLFLIFSILTSCQTRRQQSVADDESVKQDYETIRKVTFFIENSESTFGYVSSNTEYVAVITELAQKTDLVKAQSVFDFNFINGRELQISSIGNDPSRLAGKLNPAGFRTGDITRSNLNAMFEKALASAGGDSISILVSDGIYDVGNQNDPLNALINEGKGLRTKFIQRLMNENLQTLLVKFTSQFRGDYFPGMGGVVRNIDQQRPYYIWIFGTSELLTRHFSEQYLQGLEGYENMARFFVAGEFEIPYEVVAHNALGNYRFDRRNKLTLTNIERDRNTKEFQFSIAADFDEIPYPDSYFSNTGNYTSSPNYQVTEVTPGSQLSNLLFDALPFEPSHLITLKATGNPAGKLEVHLNYAFPRWIEESTTEDDRKSPVAEDTTFGLLHLTQAIKEAYTDISEKENIATFRITIQN